MLFEKSFHFLSGGIHLAFHVTGIRVASVMENTFIMYKAPAVQLPEKPAHLINDFTAVGFIPAGPDQDTRVIFIPLINGIDAVQQHRQILFPVFRDRISLSSEHSIPHTMGFHVILINDVQAVPVAQLIKSRLVRIV